jgi:hypothetical protein
MDFGDKVYSFGDQGAYDTQETGPPVLDDGGVGIPMAPTTLDETGIEPEILADLALKMASLVPQFTTDWAVQRLCLPLSVVVAILNQLVEEKQIEVRGQVGLMSHRYAVTNHGQRRGERLIEISGYVGPAPVALESYVQFLRWQFTRLPKISPKDVASALSELVLPAQAAEIAGLALMSGRSLFVHGPPGNGKTSVGRLLHGAMKGSFWVPYCLGIGSHVIRMFDPQCHERTDISGVGELAHQYDRRWVRIARPFVVVGGELTLDALDLVHTYTRGHYEAPLHVKANGGLFLLDDLGCQRVEPNELVNRWIIPLEHNVDYLTLQTGQQIEIPFRQMLVFSTNLAADQVTTPGFLRRLGYRLYLDNPTPERYRKILARYCDKCNLDIPADLVDWLLERYRTEKRPLRCCEPRDLIERVRDICAYRERPFAVTKEALDLAWKGYFANQHEKQRQCSQQPPAEPVA